MVGRVRRCRLRRRPIPLDVWRRTGETEATTAPRAGWSASPTARPRWRLVWERLWPPLATAGAVVALFLAVSWVGLWFERRARARIAGARGCSRSPCSRRSSPLVALRWPTAMRRSGGSIATRPICTPPADGFEDELANGGATIRRRARFGRCIERGSRPKSRRLRVAPPSPGMAARDPRALRFAALLLALVAGFRRGVAALRPARRRVRLRARRRRRGAATRVDAWIDPPAYTGKPPILLKVVGQAAPETVSAPEDSEIVLRAASTDYDGAA